MSHRWYCRTWEVTALHGLGIYYTEVRGQSFGFLLVDNKRIGWVLVQYGDIMQSLAVNHNKYSTTDIPVPRSWNAIIFSLINCFFTHPTWSGHWILLSYTCEKRYCPVNINIRQPETEINHVIHQELARLLKDTFTRQFSLISYVILGISAKK